jgi:hypothetical protein
MGGEERRDVQKKKDEVGILEEKGRLRWRRLVGEQREC